MGSATKLAPIADANNGVRTLHMNMIIRVGQTTNADKLIMMPLGVTPPILINDGKNVIANKIISNKSVKNYYLSLFASIQTLERKIFIISFCC